MRDFTTLYRFALPLVAATALGLGAAYAQSAPPSGAGSSQTGPDAPPASARPDAPALPPDKSPGAAPMTDGAGMPPSTGAADSGAASKSARSADNVKPVEPLGKPAEMIGLPVVGTDGQPVGQVSDVKSEADGKLEEINVTVGGFLGFGGTVVKVAGDKVSKDGRTVKLSMTSEQFKKLMN